MAHKYNDVIMDWLDGNAIQQYNPNKSAWETWEHGFDRTPAFEFGDWRSQPKKSPVEEAGITKEDLLIYFDEDNLSNEQNGLILRLKEDNGLYVTRCEVVVGKGRFHKEDLVWCYLSNLKKISP